MNEENVGKPDWLDMIPVKKHKHFTRFFKPTATGNGYFVCVPNYEIELYEIREEENRRHRRAWY